MIESIHVPNQSTRTPSTDMQFPHNESHSSDSQYANDNIIGSNTGWRSYDIWYNKSVSTKIRDRSKKFYIYDWGERFWWRWPDINDDTIKYCKKNVYLELNQSLLSGSGEAIDLDVGLFNTWHFSMFNALFNRLRRSKRRTLDPEEASMFIIPFDIALDSYLDKTYCIYKLGPRCGGHQQQVLKYHIKHSIYFKRNNGADHVVLWSLHQHHRIPDIICGDFITNICKLCTFTCYWMNYTMSNNKYISLPYPSSYHWFDNIQTLPWLSKSTTEQRHHKVIYLGSIKTNQRYGLNTKIRRAIAHECQAHTDCTHIQTQHQSVDSRVKNSLHEYMKSIFCLNPPGDDSGRRAVFDSLIAGCIPVVFDFATIYNQYPWHMTEQIALDISIYIPGDQYVSGHVKFMDILSSIDPEVIRLKQRAIEILAPTLQYSLPPLDHLRNMSDETPWDSPFEDSVDRTVNGLFARIHSTLLGHEIHETPILSSEEEWKYRYDKVRIEKPIFLES